MKRLKIDLEEIALLMDNQDRSTQNYYLDKETGGTISIPEEVMEALDEGGSTEDLPDWELALVDQAKEILVGNSRYAEIPIRPSRESYDLMVEFAENLSDEGLKEKLAIALRGKGAFRRFKDVLKDFSEAEEEWFKFKARRDKEEVIDWLESIEVQAEGN